MSAPQPKLPPRPRRRRSASPLARPAAYFTSRARLTSISAPSRGRLERGSMKALTARLMLVLAAVLPAAALAATDDAPPAWAYPVNPPDFKLPPDDGKPRHVPDSAATFTVGQTRDRFFAPDWHPAD